MVTLPSDSSANEGAPHGRPHEDTSAALGALLKSARERRGLTLEQISSETKIPRRHLEALENGNLDFVPGEFYRRAEIRTYAQAVHLDQNIVSAQLERAQAPPAPPKATPETPKTSESGLSRKRLLILAGLLVMAAVFGRAMWGRPTSVDANAGVRGATDSFQSAASVREAASDTVVGTSQRTQGDPVVPASAPKGAPAPVSEPTAAPSSVTSIPDLAAPAEQIEPQPSTNSVTELVVRTQPEGAHVTVNGIGWGTAPVTIRHLPVGDKRIRVSKDGYTTEERVVPLVGGHVRVLDIQLRGTP